MLRNHIPQKSILKYVLRFFVIAFFLAFAVSSIKASTQIVSIADLTNAYKAYIVQTPVVVPPPVTKPTTIIKNVYPTSTQTATVSDAQVLASLKRLLAEPDIATQLRGPQGPAGTAGSSGGGGGSSSPSQNQLAGLLKLIKTNTANLAASVSSASLNISGDATIGGNISVAGDSTLSGDVTLRNLLPTISGHVVDGITSTSVGTDAAYGISAATGLDGFTRFTYQDANTAAIKYGRCTDADCTNPVIKTFTPYLDPSRLMGSKLIALGSDGFARIIYTRSADDNFYMIRCLDADCSSYHDTAIDTSNADDGYYGQKEITMGQDDFPRIAYMDNGAIRNIIYTRCTDADCSSPIHTDLGVSDAEGASDMSMSLGSDGLARIAYQNNIGGDLMLLRCTNADCSSKVINTVDSNEIGDRGVSLKIGSDDLPRIVTAADGSDIHLYRCSDISCSSSSSSILAQHDNHFVNAFTFALRPGNLPSIPYQSGTDHSLHILNCTNETCSTSDDVLVALDIGSSTQGPINSGEATILGTDGLPMIITAGGPHALISFYRLGALDGEDFTDGSSIGTSENPFGNINGVSINGTNLNISGSSTLTGPLAVEGNSSLNGDINVAGTSTLSGVLPGTVGSTVQGITITSMAPHVATGVSIARGSDGFLRVAYEDAHNESMHYMRCTDADCTDPVVENFPSIFSGQNDAGPNFMTLGSDGFARITYPDSDSGNINMIRCLDQDCSQYNVNELNSDTNNDGWNGIAIVMGQDDFPRISYADNNNPSTVRYIRCTDADCTSPVITDTGVEEGNTRMDAAMAINPDGFATILFVDAFTTSVPKMIRCTNDDCTSPTIITVLNTNNAATAGQAIAMGSDGFPRLLYAHGGGELNFIKCTDTNCTSPVITDIATISGYGNTADGYSMALRSGDLASFAYQAEDGSLHVVNCTNADCTASHDVFVHNVSASMGAGDAIVIGTDGMPIVMTSDFGGDMYLSRFAALDGEDFITGSSLGTSSSGFGDIYGLSLHAGPSGNPFIVNQLGNVGIGTVTPTAPLTISSTALNISTSSQNALDITPTITDPTGFPNVLNVSPHITYNSNDVSGGSETLNLSPIIDGSGNTPFLVGIGNYPTYSGSGTVSYFDGLDSGVVTTGSGTTTEMYGITSAIYNRGTGTVSTAAGINIGSNANSGGGTLTDSYGLKVADQTAGTNNWAIKTGLGQVSFGDNVGIGTTNPIVKFQAVASDGGLPNNLDTMGHFIFQDNGTADTWNTVSIISGTNAGVGLDLGNTNTGNLGGIYYDSSMGELYLRSGSYNALYIVGSTGNVGLSTTNAEDRLEVTGAACFDTAPDTNCTTAGTAGDIYYGTAHANWTDIAEKYPSLQSLNAGDVVMIDTTAIEDATIFKPYITLADGTNTTLGIISTHPGMTLGDDYGKSEDYSLTLAGRVPVNFSNENGEVLPGDHLTLSLTKPGLAMKQTTSGNSIGIALQSSTNNTQVLTLVNLNYQQLNISLTDAPVDLTPNSGFITGIIAWLGDVGNGIGKIFAGELDTKQVCLVNDSGEKRCINKDQLDSLLGPDNSQNTPSDPTPPDSGDTTPPADDSTPPETTPPDETVTPPADNATPPDTTSPPAPDSAPDDTTPSQ